MRNDRSRILGGIGALAVGPVIVELRGRRIDNRAVDISKSSAGTRVGEYLPPPDDGRPPRSLTFTISQSASHRGSP